jgi:hypothetical protein
MMYVFHAAIPALIGMYYEIFMEKDKKNFTNYLFIFFLLYVVNIFFGHFIYHIE